MVLPITGCQRGCREKTMIECAVEKTEYTKSLLENQQILKWGIHAYQMSITLTILMNMLIFPTSL